MHVLNALTLLIQYVAKNQLDRFAIRDEPAAIVARERFEQQIRMRGHWRLGMGSDFLGAVRRVLHYVVSRAGKCAVGAPAHTGAASFSAMAISGSRLRACKRS